MASHEVRHLLGVLRDPEFDASAAFEALSRLEKIATADDLPALRAAIESDRHTYLAEVVGPIVGELEGLAALPFLLRVLRRGQERGADHDGLAFHITELVTLNREAVALVLAEMAASATAAHRRDAAWLWGYAAEALPVEPLLALSHDSDPHVAGTAIGALTCYKGNKDVFQRFTDALADENEELRIDAISALGYYEDRRAVPLLRPFAKDASDTVRRIAEYALKRLG